MQLLGCILYYLTLDLCQALLFACLCLVEIVSRSPGWPLIPHLARTILNFRSSCLLFSCAGAIGIHYQGYMVLEMEGWT